jgi:hypothetical protein
VFEGVYLVKVRKASKRHRKSRGAILVDGFRRNMFEKSFYTIG